MKRDKASASSNPLHQFSLSLPFLHVKGEKNVSIMNAKRTAVVSNSFDTSFSYFPRGEVFVKRLAVRGAYEQKFFGKYRQ